MNQDRPSQTRRTLGKLTLIAGPALLLALAPYLAADAPLLNTPPAAQAHASAAAALRLLDDFSNPKLSATIWNSHVAGASAIRFEPRRVTMDMPGCNGGNQFQSSPVNLAHLYSKTSLHLARAGDSLRVTWDMQLLADRPNAFGFGICLGDSTGQRTVDQRIVAGQFGQKSGLSAPHDIFLLPDAPTDHADHGTGPLHYDLTVTLDNAATGAVHVTLRAYTQVAEFDPTPELYTANAKPVATLTSKGQLNISAPIPLYFCVERDDAAGDPYITTPRSKIAITNVFISETPDAANPADPEPLEESQ